LRLGRIFGDKPVFATPADTRVYAIGDVHGRDDLLGDLADRIEQDLRSAPSSVITVLVGDYVDRGPSSKAVLERLAASRFPTPIRALRGNHEEMFLEFLGETKTLERWRKLGGLETLHSYGVDVAPAMRGEGFEEAGQALSRALPASHLAFLRQTLLSVEIGDYFFCHAGVMPGVPLHQQRPEHLMWIREPFLRDDSRREKIVVHGHTPVARPDVRPYRINIDTGAFASSLLTCLVLEGPDRRFLFAGDPR
jgi:serine/threonine protein phosphatase 1